MKITTQQDLAALDLRDIFGLLKHNRRLIASGVIVGLFFSMALIFLLPKKYEARMQFRVAKMANLDKAGIVNVEEPLVLVQRLRASTAYTDQVRNICEVTEGHGEAEDYLNGQLKIEAIRNVPDWVEIKVRGYSPAKARKCAEAIVLMLTEQQQSEINERLKGKRLQGVTLRKLLAAEEAQLEGFAKNVNGGFGYLAQRDKLSDLRARIGEVDEQLLLSQQFPPKLVTDIVVPSTYVSPRVGMLLLLGGVLGLVLGIFLALLRGWKVTKKE